MPARYNFISRGLSEYETVLDLLQQHGDGIVCHVMILKSTNVISGDVIHNAFKWLVHYQPSLRMAVQTEIGTHGLVKRFAERKDISDFEVETVSSPTSDWSSLVETESVRPFVDPESLLWKVTFVEFPNKTSIDIENGGTLYVYGIVFKVSHVLADHVSVHTLLNVHLLQLLQRTDDVSGLDRFRTPLFMKPSVDQSFLSVNKVPPVVKKTKGKPAGMTPAVKEMGLSREFSVECDSDVTSGIRTSVNALSKIDVDYISRLCFKYDISPNDVITVAVVHAFGMTAHAQNIPVGRSGIKICHWMDMRTVHPVPREGDPLGMWLCPIFTKHKINKHQPKHSKFWNRVKKFSKTQRSEHEPWKRSFHAYHELFGEINKLADCDDPDFAKIQPPKAHVSVSLLDTKETRFNEPHMNSHARGSSSLTRSSRVKSAYSSQSTRSSVGTDDLSFTAGDSKPLVVDEYHVTRSASAVSVSPLNLSVVFGEGPASCTLVSDTSKVSHTFAESLLATFCRVIANMVRSTDRLPSVVVKLPPYVRARLMTSPGVSKI